MKKIFFVRHCLATGQHKDAPLTQKGVKQSYQLAQFFSEQRFPIDRIISSPYLRAIDTIKPYAEQQGIAIELDHRLEERILSGDPIDDWFEMLAYSFVNKEFKLPGGESSHEATQRGLGVLATIFQDQDHDHIICVSHGNLIALIIHYYDQQFGFDGWRRLQYPDLFMMTYTDRVQSIKHIELEI